MQFFGRSTFLFYFKIALAEIATWFQRQQHTTTEVKKSVASVADADIALSVAIV
jgi:hypothetical protein